MGEWWEIALPQLPQNSRVTAVREKDLERKIADMGLRTHQCFHLEPYSCILWSVPQFWDHHRVRWRSSWKRCQMFACSPSSGIRPAKRHFRWIRRRRENIPYLALVSATICNGDFGFTTEALTLNIGRHGIDDLLWLRDVLGLSWASFYRGPSSVSSFWQR